ncbi:MAG: M1 family aminopeptidase [Mariprofundaceae bacterium]
MTVMRASIFRLLAAAALLLAVNPCWAAEGGDARQHLSHDLSVLLNPDQKYIQVMDTIRLPAGHGAELEFVLHAGLDPRPVGQDVSIEPVHAGNMRASVPLERFRLSLPEGRHSFTLRYGGEIHHPLRQGAGESRSFRTTPGLIANEGVFLSGTAHWYPQFNDDLITFSLDVELPDGWMAVSQGVRMHGANTSDEPAVAGSSTVRWESHAPQDEIYLVAARFTEYRDSLGAVQVQAFLRTPDAALAKRYLDASIGFLEMYGALLGPYPYGKFALVENFWQTGFGMPSFTLLGDRIIRMPFILQSSYPHEILHNWWGNGVYVDYRGGNWSEGLTAYLADHLLKEQQGKGALYRRNALQRYTNFVNAGTDFPLAEFRGRFSPASEAVGYGKTMMLFHALRRQMGDEAFISALRRFYQEHEFRRASFADIEKTFGEAARAVGFGQWLKRPGAPQLAVSQARSRAVGDVFELHFTLEQVQDAPPFQLVVPVAVSLEGLDQAFQTELILRDKRVDIRLSLPRRPLRVDIDPRFDVFRRLAAGEMPPALGQVQGAADVLILLPSDAPPLLRDAYRDLAENWQQRYAAAHIEVRPDRELEALPADKSVWVFGWNNRFLPDVAGALSGYDVQLIERGGLILEGEQFSSDEHSVALSMALQSDAGATLNWLAMHDVAAMPGLARKLPHYGKYSYLVFNGDGPNNVLKGQWPVLRSSLTAMVAQENGEVIDAARAGLEHRRALIGP